MLLAEVTITYDQTMAFLVFFGACTVLKLWEVFGIQTRENDLHEEENNIWKMQQQQRLTDEYNRGYNNGYNSGKAEMKNKLRDSIKATN